MKVIGILIITLKLITEIFLVKANKEARSKKNKENKGKEKSQPYVFQQKNESRKCFSDCFSLF